MADKPLKSLKFPGLSDTYTVPQIASDLATSGKGAESKATGDAISAINTKVENVSSIITIIDTASGAIASFPDGADGMPLKSLVINIEPIQAGSGDPSPDNVRPITGWTGANVTACGANAMANAVISQGTIKGTDGTDNTANNRCRTSAFSVSGNVIVKCPSGFEFTTRIYATDNTYIADESDTASWIATDKVYQITGDRLMRLVIRKANDANITPSGVATFYVYKNHSISTISWQTEAGTVYGGTLEPLTGKLKARPYYASYNGETLVGPWVSSIDAYTPGGTPTTGAQVVDLGGTVTEYDLDPVTINSKYGQNNIFADTGDITAEYIADTKLYINKVVAALA